MGTSVLLDIIGSMVIGGLLLLTALEMNDSATQNTYQSQENLTVQQNITSLVENLEWDFRKLGYCANPMLTSDPTHYILKGTSDSISFVADTGNVGVLNTITWYLGSIIPGPILTQ